MNNEEPLIENSPEQKSEHAVVATVDGAHHIDDNRQADMGFPPELRELIAVERERIDSTNRRTDVAKYAIEMSDASDKRQFEFQMAQLRSQTDGSRQRFILACGIAISVSVLAVVFGGALLWMAFFGTPSQTEAASAILKTLGIGAGGYGVIGGAIRGIKAMLDRRN